ncbi:MULTISPECIES: class I SAM-dependent methyltransferase [Sphingobium]|uniref:class I SAM-dependent methyltransferase n=1 Tax=Sphingobium TaxID=165695 RepID=UPI00159C2D74|nr:class I SAM-dependent methyltransferase [Sphingobium sp. 15-1]
MPKSRLVLSLARRIPLVRRFYGKAATLGRDIVRQKTIAGLQCLSLHEARGSGDFACTACREEYALAPFEQRADRHGTVYDLWICLNCLAILNATHLRAIRQGADFRSWQSDSSDEFYAVDDAYLAAVPDAIDACGFIDFLLSAYPEQSRSVFLDFGAGRGILSGAAAKDFDKVYAAELSLNVLRKVHAVMPGRDRIVTTDDYLGIKDGFDAIASMHVLEHLPNMRDIVDTLVERMNPGGSLFFQVPMLRKDYLVNVHYTFFTEASARALCRDLGLETVGVWFDHALDFLTCIARKPS